VQLTVSSLLAGLDKKFVGISAVMLVVTVFYCHLCQHDRQQGHYMKNVTHKTGST